MPQTFRLLTWNINGISASVKKGIWEKLQTLQPDIFCFQEIKATDEKIQLILNQEKQLENKNFDLYGRSTTTNLNFLDNYNHLWHVATVRKGYSGVATFWQKNLVISKSKIGTGEEKFDIEGRLLLTEFKLGEISVALINGYYPQGGRGIHRIEYKIKFYQKVTNLCKQLRKQGKKIILCGDFNTTVADIDLARPKQNRNTTGCLPEERDALAKLTNVGLVDAFRYLYPNLEGKYTYWDQITRSRERNVGWRIDFFLVDQDLISKVEDCLILDQIFGSDHCPVVLSLSI